MAGSFDNTQPSEYRPLCHKVQSDAGADAMMPTAARAMSWPGRNFKDSTQRAPGNAKIAKEYLSLRRFQPKAVSKTAWRTLRFFAFFALNPTCLEIASSVRSSQ
jgi:hypothetical protein